MNKMFSSVAIAQLVQAKEAQVHRHTSHRAARIIRTKRWRRRLRSISCFHPHLGTRRLLRSDESSTRKDCTYCDLKDYLQFFASEPLQSSSRERDGPYSNAGMLVAGLVIERVSGKNFHL